MSDESATSVAEEVAAEIQVAAAEEVERLKEVEESAQALEQRLRGGNVFRSVSPSKSEHVVSAVTTAKASRPAFSGLLFGVVAIRIDMTVEGSKIKDVNQDTRSRIELCDFGDSTRRIRWEARRLATELISSTLDREPEPDIVVYDNSLTITRQDLLTYEDSPAADDWEALLEFLDEFWSLTHETLYPWADNGPLIVGLSKMRANLLFTALRNAGQTDGNGPNAFLTDIAPETVTAVDTQWEQIKEVGPNRLINMALNGGERTLAYPFEQSSLDRRWLPSELQSLGVQGLFYRPTNESDPLHLEIAGNVEVYDEARLEDYLQIFADLFWLSDVDVPVPVWYARREASFPDKMLDLYHKKLQTDSQVTDE